MKKTRWIRGIALSLALVLLVTVVGALSFDLNGDGKTNVWDLQLAINQGKSKEDRAAALKEAMGGKGDELHKNAEGKYEIWSSTGLYNMAEHATEGATFVLMADIDMQGVDWTPIASFKGVFEGNLHTISNVNITKSVEANMGLFGTVERYTRDGKTVQSEVKDLNLVNIRITATADSQYIGLLSGSNRGKITNCTTQGLVTDSRTVLEKAVYVGAFVGRNNNHDTLPGVVSAGTNLLTATAGTDNPEDKVEGVSAKLAMDFATLDGTNTNTRSIGIAGYSKVANDMIWQDVSNDSSRLPEKEQQLRQTAVDEMYQMGTVQWTTSELLTYTVNGKKTGTHSNIYIPGTTYYGIPYNGLGGGYDRALSIMQTEKDAQGRFVTVTGLENGVKDDTAGKQTGFIQYMGNDCSSAIGWAWAAVSPARMANNGARVTTTPYMVPNEYNIEKYGMLPAGDYQMLTSDTEKYSAYIDARDTQSIIALNGGAQGMAEYFTKTHKGDALLCVEYDLDTATDKWVKGTGHARMVAEDPVIIRDYKGKIDLNKSYVITHEQGDGLFDNRNASGKYDTYEGYNIKQTSWRINHKYSLYILLTEEGYQAAEKAGQRPGCGWGYVPVTIEAFTYEGELRAPYYNAGYEDHPIILPNSGWYYSNWMVASATLTITDSDGNQVYAKTGYPSGRTVACENLKLDELFGDATAGLTAGQTYYCTLTAKASNGEVTTIAKNHAFTPGATE